MPLKKNYPWNVLVFPAASEIGFEINHALGDSKEVILHGANQAHVGLADFHFQRLYELPSIVDPTCLIHLQTLIAEYRIDAIFPAHDDVLLWLAEHAKALTAQIITSNVATCRICRSKQATYASVEGSIRVPRLWKAGDPNIQFSIFVKPDRGQGSQHARRIENFTDLNIALASNPDLLVMEYLPGREYTVDCFSQHGEVLFARARERLQTKAGISTLTRTKNLPFAQEWAKKISSCLDLRGAWFFQTKEDASGQPCLLEIAPRIAGSMALNRVTGPNFPLLNLYESAGHMIQIDAIDITMSMGRSLNTRFVYDRPIDALYIDLDDTLIIRGEVNTRLVALIFQCRNRGIPVHLITHHPGNLQETLAKFRIGNLFDQIFHLPDPQTPKAGLIRGKNAVLIDDSFRERQEAVKTLGIRCFDTAGAICLLDERR